MKYLNHNESVNKLVELLAEEKIIPIFGSGFTAGSLARYGKVLDSKSATEIMNKIILKTLSDASNSNDFFEVADIFIEAVPVEEKDNFFKNYFTSVKLDKIEKSFLNLPWIHAYTLNIDDGIEANSDFKPVLPYFVDYKNPKEIKLLYKLHGDAEHEIKYKNENNIIFRKDEYVKSLTEESNKKFLINYKNDYIDYNLIYIGCSLNNETDISYIYSMVKKECSDMTMRILLRKEKLTPIEEVKLQKYGINCVFVVDDYRLFYQEVSEKFSKSESMKKLEKYKVETPSIKVIDTKNFSLNLGFLYKNKLFDESQNTFHHHAFLINRDIIKEIEFLLKIRDRVVIQGRRFSGKTSVICNIIERFKENKICFFSSINTQTEETIREIIQNCTDILLIFDSNSIDSDAYLYLLNADTVLKENHIKILLFVNSGDNRLVDALNADCLRLKNVFSKIELDNFNKLVDKAGLLQRREKYTNLDYLAKLNQQEKLDEKFFINNLPFSFTTEECAVLILLSAIDKIYYKEIVTLDISSKKINILIEKLYGLIEYVNTTKKENRVKQSAKKLVTNSKFCLLSIVRNFSDDKIIEAIKFIVRKFRYSDSERIYIEIVLFDTLNQLFDEGNGSSKIIYKIYDGLAELLNDSMDYWLQRAKSIYRRNSNVDLKSLKEAYKYAFKAHEDADINTKGHLQEKAAMSLALICGLIAQNEIDKKSKIEYQEFAINYMYEAMISEFYKKPTNFSNAIKQEKRRGIKKLILDICDSYIQNVDCNIMEKIKYIRDNFQNNEIR